MNIYLLRVLDHVSLPYDAYSRFAGDTLREEFAARVVRTDPNRPLVTDAAQPTGLLLRLIHVSASLWSKGGHMIGFAIGLPGRTA